MWPIALQGHDVVGIAQVCIVFVSTWHSDVYNILPAWHRLAQGKLLPSFCQGSFTLTVNPCKYEYICKVVVSFCASIFYMSVYV